MTTPLLNEAFHDRGVLDIIISHCFKHNLWFEAVLIPFRVGSLWLVNIPKTAH